ncbi:MAG: hypothetical protein LBG60_07880 [Bifidobacteriaceae bacterium]|nr:hypothetical protein [Bifidobacteriaceae bacterium]
MTLKSGAQEDELVRPEAAAEDLVSCLRELKLPARLEEVDGQAQLGWDPGHDVFMVDAFGGASMLRDLSRDYDQANAQAEYRRFLGEHRAEDSSPFGLEVDGADYSDEFANCVEISGYVPPSGVTDTREELVAKQALAEVTNNWLACARDNGYPDWADVKAVKADGWLTSPEAVIPLSMSTDELTRLLAACPNFDEETAERLEDPEFNWNSDFVAHPAVSVEPPAPPPDGGQTDPMAQDEYAHYQELVDALGRAESEFYQKRADEQEAAQ